MRSLRFRLSAFAAALVVLAACDDDPSSPNEQFTFAGCPTGLQGVNTPLNLSFSVPLNPATVAAGNVVVSAVSTGQEVPGSLQFDSADSTRIRFISSSPLPFDQRFRIRIQNLRSGRTNAQLPVIVCEFATELPPIRELFWERLPNAGGTSLVGASVTGPGRGFAISLRTPIFRRSGNVGTGTDTTRGEFSLVFQEPAYLAGFDVAFVSETRGFASFSEFRLSRSPILETRNGGVTFDTIGFLSGRNASRLYFRPVGNTVFGVVGGGNTTRTTFRKYTASTSTLGAVQEFAGTGQIVDIDAPPADTTNVFAVGAGVEVVNVLDVRGTLWRSTNGGATWAEVPGTRADPTVQTYLGVAMRSNTEVWVTGGSGFVARFSFPTVGGTPTMTRFLQGVVTNPDTTSPNALVFTDVQFAPDDPMRGWIVGAQLVGFTGGVPRYQGLIFATRDGGQTWVRQGVRGANNYGAEFPRLNRLSVLSSTVVWIVGEGGEVLQYSPAQ